LTEPRIVTLRRVRLAEELAAIDGAIALLERRYLQEAKPCVARLEAIRGDIEAALQLAAASD